MRLSNLLESPNLVTVMTQGIKNLALDIKLVKPDYLKMPGAKAKNCFNNAYRYVMAHPESRYILGYALIHGVPIEHAWVRSGDQHIDVTLDPEKMEQYYEVLEVYPNTLLRYVVKNSHAPDLFSLNRFVAKHDVKESAYGNYTITQLTLQDHLLDMGLT